MAEIEAGTLRQTGGHGSSSGTKDEGQSSTTVAAIEVLFDVPLIFSGAIGDPRDIQTRIPSRPRGILHRLAIVHDIEEPKHYGRKIKWFITFLVAGVAVIDALSSFTFWRMVSCIFPEAFTNRLTAALRELSIDLRVSPAVASLSTGISYISPAIFPLWWSVLSETVGRRTVYIVSLFLYIIFNILSALASSIGMLIAIRFLSSGAAASVVAVGAGAIADIWDVSERGTAIGIFYLGILATNGLGPVVGGALTQKWGWRATQWFLAIYGGTLFVGILFCLPETFRGQCPVLQEKPDSGVQGKRSYRSKIMSSLIVARRIFFDPLRAIAYLRYPAILLLIYLASITWGIYMFLCISLQQSFAAAPYHFSSLIVGLTFIPLSMGLILASTLGGRWSDYVMTSEAKKAGRYNSNGTLIYRPEDRLGVALIPLILYPSALVWYGWTVEKGVLWILPVR